MTSAPIAAPRPIGSRPSRRTVRTGRGFDFAFCPPPFPSAGKDATTASWATCAGCKENPNALRPPSS
ncbi:MULTISPECIES: hypothetical protein [Streptomyces]|uniref:hypothetical protein n=1 Tax=Streptomyces TaxID=1883 RepID=UPI0033AF6C8C